MIPVVRRFLFLRPVPYIKASHELVVSPVLAASSLQHVRLLYNPRRPLPQARADGVLKRYIEVGPNWLALSLSDPAAARAILAHECAHHTYHDVLPARVAWWSGPAVLAWTALYVYGAGIEGWNLLAPLTLVAVLLVVRLGALHAREYAADRAASSLEADALKRILNRDSHRSATPRLWKLIVDPHPPTSRRARAVERDAVEVLQPLQGLAVGTLAGIAAPNLQIGAQGLDMSARSTGAYLVASPIVFAILAWWLVVHIRRYASDDSALVDPQVNRGAHFALFVAFGVANGYVIFRYSIYAQGEYSRYPSSAFGWFSFIALVIAVMASVQLLLETSTLSFRRAKFMFVAVQVAVVGSICAIASGWLDVARLYDAHIRDDTRSAVATALLLFGSSEVGKVAAAAYCALFLTIFLTGRRAARKAEFKPAFIGGLLSGTTALIAYSAYRFILVPNGKDSAAPNWLARELTPLSALLLPAVVVSIGTSVTALLASRMPHRRGGIASLIAAPLAAAGPTMVSIYRGAAPVDAFDQFVTVFSSTLFLSLLAGGVTALAASYLPSIKLRNGIVSTGTAAATLMLVACCASAAAAAVSAPKAVPTMREDLQQIFFHMDRIDFSICRVGGGQVVERHISEIEKSERWLLDPDQQPGTLQGVRYQQEYLELIRACRQALANALGNDAGTVDAADAAEVEHAWQRVFSIAEEYDLRWS
ncbi:M48 family metalloprotease [Actinomycetospora lutea]|nr:M48 family metalloprotease [Actinomycetospora lutea]MDD7942819.1 M48 family metalloprotease [Actinomycetospora lutea]